MPRIPPSIKTIEVGGQPRGSVSLVRGYRVFDLLGLKLAQQPLFRRPRHGKERRQERDQRREDGSDQRQQNSDVTVIARVRL